MPDIIYGLDKTLSLRDWFAGQALAGINANHVLAATIAKDAYDNNESPIIALADMAYAMADAMLEKRGK